MIEIREYVDSRGRSPFSRWYNKLDPTVVTRVRAAFARMQEGNMSDVRGVGGGVMEYRIHTGPGYRIYFGRKGDILIILLGGGTKARQRKDIENARRLWREHNRRK